MKTTRRIVYGIHAMGEGASSVVDEPGCWGSMGRDLVWSNENFKLAFDKRSKLSNFRWSFVLEASMPTA